jgi:glucosamine 6-phosphate synthetase-like amidotransferase/phosphosugar isomerase protein
MLGSDIGGLENKSNVMIVEDNTIGFIDINLTLSDISCNKCVGEWRDLSAYISEIDRGSYPHFMLKEIMEIPSALRRTWHEFTSTVFKMPRNIRNVLIVACGTSYHSGLMICKYIEKIAGIRAECKIASEFLYNHLLLQPNTLFIFISQSGETADTLSALRRAKGLGVFTLGITNVRGSTITNLADEILYLEVGPEICVASTKAYTSQVFLGLLLSFVLRGVRDGVFEIERGTALIDWQIIKDDFFITKLQIQKLFILIMVMIVVWYLNLWQPM